MMENLINENKLWSKLPDELKIYIFDLIYKKYEILEIILNFQNIRQLCYLSNYKFKQKFINSKDRLECRESLCSSKLSSKCIFGKYCSLNCYYEHIMLG